MELNLVCPVCNSKRTSLYHDKVFGLEKAKVYKCENCKLIFLFPYLNQDEVEELYNNYNKISFLRGVFKKEPKPAEVFNLGLKEAQIRFKRFKKYITNKSILELGAGAGSFLYLAKKVTKQIYVIEPCERNRVFVKGNISGNVFKDIRNLIDRNIKVDTVFLFHVLEHIVNPADIFKQIKNILKDNGSLIIEVPNADDALITVYDIKEFKNFYFQAQHPLYYNRIALRYVLKKNGYELDKLIYHQRYGIDNHLNWMKNRTQGGNINFKNFFTGLDRFYRRYIVKTKKTDTISVVSFIRSAK